MAASFPPSMLFAAELASHVVMEFGGRWYLIVIEVSGVSLFSYTPSIPTKVTSTYLLWRYRPSIRIGRL